MKPFPLDCVIMYIIYKMVNSFTRLPGNFLKQNPKNYKILFLEIELFLDIMKINSLNEYT